MRWQEEIINCQQKQMIRKTRNKYRALIISLAKHAEKKEFYHRITGIS